MRYLFTLLVVLALLVAPTETAPAAWDCPSPTDSGLEECVAGWVTWPYDEDGRVR